MIEANTLEGIKNGKADADSNKSLKDDEAPVYVKVCRFLFNNIHNKKSHSEHSSKSRMWL